MESLTNPARQFTRSQFRLRRHQIPKMLAHLGRQLVRIFGPWLVRQQSFEPTLLKVMLGLVNRRARKAKFSGRLSTRLSLFFTRHSPLVIHSFIHSSGLHDILQQLPKRLPHGLTFSASTLRSVSRRRR
jgi:hypothetical protein